MALAGFDDAPVYNRLPQFDVGSYVAEVIRMEKFSSADEPNNFRFKTEFRILEASPGSKLNPGDEVAEVLPLFGKYKATFFGKVKTMLGAIAEEPARKIKETDLDEAVAEDQPFAGHKVRVFVVTAEKKDSKETYPRASYATYKPLPNGQVAAAPA